MPAEAFAVHGLSSEFLADKPLFDEVVEEFLEFIADAPLVIHNASFDIGFINAELDRVKRPAIPRDRLVDTLLLARRKHPGVSNRLDDLCSRYAIDNSRRTKHGALARRRASGRSLYRSDRGAAVAIDPGERNPRYPRRRIRRNAAAATSVAACAANHRGRSPGASGLCRHAGRQADLERFPERLSSAGLRQGRVHPQIRSRRHAVLANAARLARLDLRGLCGSGLPFHVLAVQTDKIDRIEHQRRETAVAHRGRDDFAGEREQ